MNSQNSLEIKGFLHLSSFAELLTEIAQHNLNGSLRLENEKQKAIIYFDAGEAVFAASNARQHRLFEFVLREKKITTAELSEIKNFTNDLVLRDSLIRQNMLSKREADELFKAQIKEILQVAFGWKRGDWVFSPLVRVKNDIHFTIDLQDMLLDYARELEIESVRRRFKNEQESFAPKPTMPAHINLLPQEAFVFSRFEGNPLTIEEIMNLSGLPEAETYKTIYVLWLTGFLLRQNWNEVFSERNRAAISSAKLALKKSPASVTAVNSEYKNAPPPAEEQPQEITETPEKTEPPKDEISAEEYLKRVESAESYYEILGVALDTDAAEIKAAYFALAKRFHPDLFNRKTDADLHYRIQQAFTEIAQAYETLKTQSSREVYDFKLRKKLESKPKTKVDISAAEAEAQKKAEQAEQDFEQGLAYLLEEEYEQAIPFLGRAVHAAGDNAKYRAHYGKALAGNKETYRQAEAELQTAVRLDADNADYRLMLVEIYLTIGLVKRAVGELNRLLDVKPNHNAAQALLDSLLKKGYK